MALLSVAVSCPAPAQRIGAEPAAAGSEASAKTDSQEEPVQLLAPIALYLDALRAQMRMASTYPLEIVSDGRKFAGSPGKHDGLY